LRSPLFQMKTPMLNIASYDVTWIGYDVYVWSGLETHLAIICASAPALRVFFRKYLSSPVSRMVSSAKSGSNPWNTNRDSKTTDHGAVVLSPQDRFLSIDLALGLGEKKLVNHHIKPTPSAVGDMDAETALPSINQSYVVRTPADFEAYALQNLEKNRPPYRPTFLRQSSDEDELEGGVATELKRAFNRLAQSTDVRLAMKDRR